MTYKILATTLVLAFSLAGCAKDGSQIARQNPDDFDKVKEPDINANTYFAGGQLAESQQQYDKAEYQYKKSLRYDPKHEGSMYRLACMYAQEKRYGDAIAVWQRYVKATEGSAGAYNNLAFCEELAGQPVDAERDYRKGIAKDPKNEPCQVNFGLMLARSGRVNEAVLHLQSVLSPAEVHYNLAGVYEQQRRPELAKGEYKQAVELDPNFDEARTKLAQLELE